MKTLITIVVVILFIVTTILINHSLLLTNIPTKYLFGIITIIDICLATVFSILNDYLIVKLDK